MCASMCKVECSEVGMGVCRVRNQRESTICAVFVWPLQCFADRRELYRFTQRRSQLTLDHVFHTFPLETRAFYEADMD